jgi:hypothetical protein
MTPSSMLYYGLSGMVIGPFPVWTAWSMVPPVLCIAEKKQTTEEIRHP